MTAEPLTEGWARAKYGRSWHWFIGERAYCGALIQPARAVLPTRPAHGAFCTKCEHKLARPRIGHKEQL